MKDETVQAAITGMKQAGIDFIAYLPASGITKLTQAIAKDPDFKKVLVANENEAIGICLGAWMAGKKPAFVAQNSGLLMATYALMDSIYFFGAFPLLMLIDHRGTFGDGGGYWFFGYGVQIPRILDAFQVAYTVVTETSQVAASVTGGQRTAQTYGKAAAILLSGEGI
jgi:sulfopyruvate decarboxylase TPP-binding subunit